MTNNYTLVRVTKAVVRRLKVAAPMLGKGQQEVADSLLTQAMDARQIPMPLPLGKREAAK